MKLIKGLRAAAAVAATTALDKLKGWAMCIPSSDYYAGFYPYRNMVRHSGDWDATGALYMDANGWLQNVPNGVTVTRSIVFAASYVPPGDYTITCSGGMHCKLFSAFSPSYFTAIHDGSFGSPAATFTVIDQGVDFDYTNCYIYVQVINATGAPANCTDLFVGLTSNLTGHSFSINATADQIFDPTFLLDMAGVAAIKYADSVLLNKSGTNFWVAPSDLANEASCNWASRSNAGPKGPAYSTMAKLCKYLNCVNWVCFPPVYNSYQFSVLTATDVFTSLDTSGNAVAHTWSTGQPLGLWGYLAFSSNRPTPLVTGTLYYAIVLSTTTFKVADSLAHAMAGTALHITEDFNTISNGYGYEFAGIYDPGPIYDAIVDQIYAVDPAQKVVGQHALEPWNGAFYFNQTKGPCSYFPAITGEATVLDPSASMAWRCARIWKSIERKFSHGQYARTVENQGTAFSFSLANVYDWVDTVGMVAAAGTRMGDMMDASSSAYYPHFRITTGGSTSLSVMDMITLGAATSWVDADFSTYMRNGIQDWGAGMLVDRNTLNTKTSPRTLPMLTYEDGLGESVFTASIPNGIGSYGATFNAATDVVTSSSANTLLVGMPVQFYEGSNTSVLPTPIVSGQTYYVQTLINSTDFKISATFGGAVLNITGALVGSASMTMGLVFTSGTGVISAGASLGLAVNYPVSFSGGTLPTNLVAGTVYWVQSVTGATFKVSATIGGAAIGSFSGTPSGYSTFTCRNSAITDFETRFYSWLRGTQGGADYTYYLSYLNAAEIQLNHHYTCYGNSGLVSSGFYAWGYKRSQYFADTPMETAIKAYAGVTYYLPGQPQSLATGARTTTTMVLTWVAPTIGPGVSSPTNYIIEYRTTVGPGTWTTWSHSASTAVTQTVTGLTPNTSYDFRGTASNTAGTGVPSSTATRQTDFDYIDSFNRGAWSVTASSGFTWTVTAGVPTISANQLTSAAKIDVNIGSVNQQVSADFTFTYDGSFPNIRLSGTDDNNYAAVGILSNGALRVLVVLAGVSGTYITGSAGDVASGVQSTIQATISTNGIGNWDIVVTVNGVTKASGSNFNQFGITRGYLCGLNPAGTACLIDNFHAIAQ